MANLELGEDRGAEQRFDYDSEEEKEDAEEEAGDPDGDESSKTNFSPSILLGSLPLN